MTHFYNISRCDTTRAVETLLEDPLQSESSTDSDESSEQDIGPNSNNFGVDDGHDRCIELFCTCYYSCKITVGMIILISVIYSEEDSRVNQLLSESLGISEPVPLRYYQILQIFYKI